ncbi:hypothetical protein [Lacrimispora sphenoides]|uniref:Flavin reductase like domain-containing protein n=1 Tax=Lacrimispora sphenoides JCM 1415 TaxID=1297793 RepID=A0ABY1C9X4_9FIRM|nr:hypothetical protein [Lacrimispora sphenoides]SET82843.1 hypothetical protein SAMN02745906_2239 [[Clostridium] sphenoides JCM 1415]SUY51588.1 flavin reductase domain-containing FMN-binding protein [Lacrimispora sphenoides]
MKKEFKRCPETINKSELYGFSWIEYVLAIPSPLIVVTSYKDNGKPNATYPFPKKSRNRKSRRNLYWHYSEISNL